MPERKVSILIQAKDAATQVLQRFSGSITAVATGFLALRGAANDVFRAIRNVAGAISSAIKAYKVQEDAVVSLRESLVQTGKVGSDALNQIIQRAGELQRVTTKGDEALIKASSSLALLAPSLNAPELAKAQEAIIGIADVFLKGDVENAAQLLGKTIGSTTNALTRYGIRVDTTAGQSEKLRQVLEQTAGMFEVSRARAGTLEGRQLSLTNAFSDFQEVLGQTVVEGTNLVGILENITEVLRKITNVMPGIIAGLRLARAFRGGGTGPTGRGLGPAVELPPPELPAAIEVPEAPAFRTLSAAVPHVQELTAAIVDLSERGLGEPSGQVGLLAHLNEFPPLMQAVTEGVTISRAEIEALGAEVATAGPNLEAMSAKLDELGLSGANAAAVLEAAGRRFEGFGEVTEEQAALILASTTALKFALTDIFTELADSIGKVLAGIETSFKGFGGAVLAIIGNLLKALGRSLIAFGIAGLAIQRFITNPAAAIAAGIALTALGSALAQTATRTVRAGGAALASGGGLGGGAFPSPPGAAALAPALTIQIVARDIDRAGTLRILEEINASGQLDAPIRIDSQLINVGSSRGR